MREIYEEERIEAIKRHVEGERSVEIYRSLGKSKPWFMKWWKRYRAGNKEWYKDLPKRPHIIGVTQNASAYQDLATSISNIYAEYTEISYRNG